MNFPDQSHIDRVSDALWEHPGQGASVMVGSGFSRYARNARPDADKPPIWNEIGQQMLERLYPERTRERIWDENSTNTTGSGVPRIAQEFETAFGRNELHQFLTQRIRDTELRPSEMHARLLRLPWRDVFTTNWDTLLERVAPEIEFRNYSVVLDMNQLPLIKLPRIVKLHGSLPANLPLILTEEDYRSYPVRFAPFVNTVQQAMMETVFCLVGISGEDPNFLHWSGWVRDNLGRNAPKIYLAGWLDLLPHRRRLLEERGVVPIDLAKHPKAIHWPTRLRYRYAIEWVLHTLQGAGPYDVTFWPCPKTETGDVKKILEPVKQTNSLRPKKELHILEYTEENQQIALEQARQALETWKHNRKIYPGWLVFPTGPRRNEVKGQTDWSYQNIFPMLPNFDTVEQLYAISEFVWRLELLLEPMKQQLVESATSILETIDCKQRLIEGVPVENENWVAVSEAWRTVALALLTHARYDFNEGQFNHWIEKLDPFISQDPEVDQRICHERCLWATFLGKYKELERLLENWTVEGSDPAWKLRKAALLWEVGQPGEAVKLVKNALANILESDAYMGTVAGASREGWALWWLEDEDERLQAGRRWTELATLQSDAATEFLHIYNAISEKGGTPKNPPFDLDFAATPTIGLTDHEPGLNAYRAVRLTEVTGLPLVRPRMSGLYDAAAAGIFSAASEQIASICPELAVRLLLRGLVAVESSFDRVLSRAQVATLSPETRKALALSCKELIDFSLLKVKIGESAKCPDLWVLRLGIALESLSRLVLCCAPDMVEHFLDSGLDWYRRQQFLQHLELYTPLQNLLKRSWEAMPAMRRTQRSLDLLRVPITGMNGFEASIPADYPEPSDFLKTNDLPPAKVSNCDIQWHRVLDLLLRSLSGSEEERKRALLRLLLLARSDRITKEHSLAVAKAIWNDQFIQNHLPEGLHDWVFLLLPEPEKGQALEWFRNRMFANSETGHANQTNIGHWLYRVGYAMSELRAHGEPWKLKEHERTYLVDSIIRWIKKVPDSESPKISIRLLQTDSKLGIRGLRSILEEIKIPESVCTKLFLKAKALANTATPAFELTPSLIRSFPVQRDEIIEWLRIGIISDEKRVSGSALAGLYYWLELSAASRHSLTSPPDEFIREVGLLIASRKSVGLAEALHIAQWIFQKGTAEQQNALGQLVVKGLLRLAEELSYDRIHLQSSGDDIPRKRMLCTQLAQCMKKSPFADEPVIEQWLIMGKKDPLPEVRFAVESTANL